MKVLILGDAGSPHLVTIATGLLAAGVGLTVASYRAPAPELAELTSRLPASLPRVVPYRAAARARKLWREGDFDLVHAHYASSYGFVGRLSRLRPLVVSVWGSDVLAADQRSRAYRAVLRDVLRTSDVVLATSDHLREVTDGWRPPTARPVIVTPFGIDLCRFTPVHPSHGGPFTIVTARHLRPNYGIDVLLRAFQLVLRTHAEARLVVAGDGPQRLTLDLLARELGIADAVSWLGDVAHGDMPSLLASAHVAVVPSISYEGFGVAALEASACGLPVIASRVGGLTEVVVDGTTGITVPPNDPAALCAALTFLADNPDVAARMGTAGAEFVATRFSQDAVAGNFVSVYQAMRNDEVSRR